MSDDRLTGYVVAMGTVSMRHLRDHADAIIDRVAMGEPMIVVHRGRSIGRLRPIRPAGLPADAMRRRWQRLRGVDPVWFRHDLDGVLDDRPGGADTATVVARVSASTIT